MRDNKQTTNSEDRATQPMEAGGWVSQYHISYTWYIRPWDGLLLALVSRVTRHLVVVETFFSVYYGWIVKKVASFRENTVWKKSQCPMINCLRSHLRDGKSCPKKSSFPIPSTSTLSMGVMGSFHLSAKCCYKLVRTCFSCPASSLHT